MCLRLCRICEVLEAPTASGRERDVELGAPLRQKRRAGCAAQLRVSSPPFFARILYCWRTMSCCGSARPEAATDKNVAAVGTRSVPVGGGGGLLQQQQFPVSHQPMAHPGIISPFPPPADASSFRPPDITPPPAVYPMAHFNGTAHSPPPSTMSTAAHSPVPPSPNAPQMGMYTSSSPPVVDPNGPLSPLRLPSPTYPTSGSSNSPNLLSTYQSSATMPSSPPIDEGKMSVSIDFGERRPREPHPTPRSKLTVMVQELPSLAW